MSDSKRREKFESKVAELLAVTSGLKVPQILMLRRMTASDPDTQSWANERELGVVFDTILDRAIAAIDVEELGAAADQHFDGLLPPGPDDARDKDRWLLFDVTKKYLVNRSKAAIAVPAAPEPPSAVIEEEEEEPFAFDNFRQMFDETLARYTRRALQVLVVNPATAAAMRPHIPLPFIISPGFANCYETLLRKFVLPDIRATKRIKELSESRTWDANGPNRLIGIIQQGGQGNPILDTWDSRWGAYKSEGVGAKHAKANDPWAVFHDWAKAGGFPSPDESDIPLLHSVIRWEPESLIEAWREVALLYQQEFHPKDRHDQAREGAFRDAIVRVIREQPKYGGDLIAMKAFFEMPKCDRMFLRKLMQTVGGTETERRRVAPGLVHFYNNLPL
ncbi:Hemerythrin [Paramagnetospirillum magnetotacticum MS-1]|uniref:Hemerythrin n=1 Tax=Paramagnetospirillum magnetotacticum MS-1 TaxID=272627 RepID=A0A0C2UB85_PARME|nr:hypothetical protein [Paramagnetospirillum magnetotacticum]KIL98757.1 Hemerythrin [Paramagnetospirillum magnetotacticum MS-1]